MSDQPFGDPVRVSATAREQLRLLDRAQQDIDARFFTRVDAWQLLADLVATPAEQLVEYDTARVLIWSIRQLAAELERLGAPLDSSVELSIQEFGGEPGGQVLTKLAAADGTSIYPEFVQADLRCRADYQVDAFVRRPARVAGAVGSMRGPSTPGDPAR